MGNKKEEIMIADIILSGRDGDADYIPLISEDDEKEMNNTYVPEVLPILPLRNTVLFPGVILPITVGREKSLELIRKAYQDDKMIGAVSQILPEIEDPTFDDINKVGTVAKIIKILEMPDGSTSVIIQGKRRFSIREIVGVDPYHKAIVDVLDDAKPTEASVRFDAIVGSLKDLSLRIIKLSTSIPQEASFAVKNIESSTFLINFIASNTDIKNADKQRLLEIDSLEDRGYELLAFLTQEVQSLELRRDIQSKVKVDMDNQQREYMLHQQMKTIQDELGGSPSDLEIEELNEKAQDKKWDEEVEQVFTKELNKLQRMNPAAGEYSVQLNYLQVMLDLPWNEYSEDNFDLKNATEILDRDHFGLEKVKDRILEHLAVLKLKGDMKSPILCLYGPPGVGKTSLGKSIAGALERQYVRMSLGGVHDESEIRGHRKTYIGAMPGRIIYNIKKAKTSNPVFILDEIDKLGKSAHGDPSSALLEVLDPEQNSTFHDNYLELDYDLSKVMFIATANNIGDIPVALRDRMEMIDVNGYIIEEKKEIAKRHLIHKQLDAHGVKFDQLSITSDAIEFIIDNYTRESGVRGLDKKIAKVVRVIAKSIAYGEKYNKVVDVADLKDILGPIEYSRDKYQGNDYAGVVTGLAWTSVGGDILFIETSISKGKGKLTLTGNLGDVMKESAVIALEYIKAHADELNIKHEIFENWNVHIHVPEGAIPKDGPSAGVTMATSLVSAFTQLKVKKNIAMTGEITLRGKVLPVGGIKEKILAAKRAGITQIILSKENQKDIEGIKALYLKGLSFTYVENVMDVLDAALMKTKVKNPIKL